MEFTKTIPTQQVSEHNSPEDCWIVIDDQVWDVTAFAPEHPGGASCKCFKSKLPLSRVSFTNPQVILKYAGRDATQAYAEYHNPSVAKDTLSIDCFKGNLDRSTITEEWKQEPVPSNVTQAAPEDEKPPIENVINWYSPYDYKIEIA